MSTSPSEFLKWLIVFGVPYGGGGSVTYPITMDKGGTGANLTPVNNSLFYSNATNGALLATPASSVLGSDALGALTWSQTLPSGTQAVSPSTANMVATKAYVDAVAAGLNPAQAVDAASVSELTGYTYDNGTSGVGATLTAGSNGVFMLDGIAVPQGEPILYKNDVAGGGAYNGVYIVTDAGSVSTPAILTRAVYYDDPDNINNTGVIPVIAGDVNQQSAWLLVSTVVAVGTSPLTYIQFGQTAGIIPLDKGGTNNNITPSAGGIVYSEALWLDVIAGVAAAGRPLLSGNLAAPTWSPFALDLGGALSTDGSVDFSGAFTYTATLTGNTAVTFPTSGVLTTKGLTFGRIATQTFSSSGTYTPTPGMLYCLVRAVGAGGGGGGADANPGATSSAGNGGGAGSFSEGAFSAATIGASQTVTIGAGGTGGSGAQGGTGGVTSFGALMSCNGGIGGGQGPARSAVAATLVIGAGGSAGSGGYNNFRGQPGGVAIASSGGGNSGFGGMSFYGGGGSPVINASGAGSSSAANGAGGGGAASLVNTAFAGGNGGNGYVEIIEFLAVA